jgi:hypothetical protein
LSRRSLLLALAAFIFVSALGFAFLFPRFDCADGARLMRDIPPPAGNPNGWICRQDDVGHVPENRTPVKVWVAVGGLLVGIALVSSGVRRDEGPIETSRRGRPIGATPG